MDLFNMNTAEFSDCRKYRYSLWRWWDKSKPYVLFIGLNPSTADETNDDKTITRCINFAKDWGYGGLCMANLFAFRATKPKDMKKADDPIGLFNDLFLATLARNAGIVIIAWGTNGNHLCRDNAVKMMLLRNQILVNCLGKNADVSPKHPLYLRKDTKPVRY